MTQQSSSQRPGWQIPALHIAAWILFFTLPYLMRPEPRHHHDAAATGYPDAVRFYLTVLQRLLLVPLFYINVLYVLPWCLEGKRRIGLLVCCQLAAIAANYSYYLLVPEPFRPGMPFRQRLFLSGTSYLFTFAVAATFYAFRKSTRMERLRKEQETVALKSELQFLRWQISPHFLFNALNNMVALARLRSNRLEGMLVDLSGLMRYMLYETDESRVEINREASYLEQYIRLQSLRYGHLKLEVRIDLPEAEPTFIEPMLLIPFVENAFKHGIDLIEEPVIRISLWMTDDGQLHFLAANKYLPGARPLSEDGRGLGLANVQKRLELLYPGRHSLQIEKDHWYSVTLKMRLS